MEYKNGILYLNIFNKQFYMKQKNNFIGTETIESVKFGTSLIEHMAVNGNIRSVEF